LKPFLAKILATSDLPEPAMPTIDTTFTIHCSQ
jgi:hypothetical protein